MTNVLKHGKYVVIERSEKEWYIGAFNGPELIQKVCSVAKASSLNLHNVHSVIKGRMTTNKFDSMFMPKCHIILHNYDTTSYGFHNSHAKWVEFSFIFPPNYTQYLLFH